MKEKEALLVPLWLGTWNNKRSLDKYPHQTITMRLEYWMCIDFCLRTRSTARSNYYNNSSKSRVDLSLPHKIRIFTFVFGFLKTPNESTMFCFKNVRLICNPNIETYQGVTSVVWLLDYPLTWWQKCGKRGRGEQKD